MTREEAIDKMEFCKRAYQMMIDENSQEGVFVGKGFEGKWKADTPLYKVYEDMRDACDMAIKALTELPKRRKEAKRWRTKALEQEPCDKCEVGNPCLYCKHEFEPKTGHWIMPVQDDGMSDPIYYQVRCSKCGFDLDPQTWHMELHQYDADKYCPKCGTPMIEPQESENP